LSQALSIIRLNYLTKMAIPEGLEPPTSYLEGRCSILLSYGTGARTLPFAASHVNRPDNEPALSRTAR
jgi:hypothetical protein